MASKRPRQPRHHRIDAACGRNFRYPAHKIIPMDGQNHLREMQRYVANVAITPSTFRKLGAGFVEAAQEFLASLNLKRSEEHTSELQSRPHLVCRLLLEKKKKRLTVLLSRTDVTQKQGRQSSDAE